MNTEEKQQLEAFDILRKAAVDRFNDRRRLEYRVLLIFWAAIVGAIAFLLREEVKEWYPHYRWSGVFLTVVFVLFVFWTKGLYERQCNERDRSMQIENAMMEVAKLRLKRGPFVRDVTGKPKSFLREWSHLTQIAMTWVLLVVLGTVAWQKRPNKAPEPTPGVVTPRATEGISR